MDRLELSARQIAAQLSTERYGRSLDVRAETGSTNDDARAAADAGAASGHVVVADAQRRGRGSHGRSWSSPAGTDLYLSIVERAQLPPHAIPVLTLAVGLGVSRAVETLAPGREVRVKWPNDVWLDGRKCAGILVESSSTGARIDAFVIGIGLGVNRTEWPPELARTATSLRAARALGEARPNWDEPPLDRAAVLARVLLEVEAAVTTLVTLGPAPTVAALGARLALVGQSVRVGDEAGVLLGLAESGALRLRTERGAVREVIAGTLRPRPNLRLRRWRKTDLDALAAIVCDAATMAAVGGPLRADEVVGLLERHLEPEGHDPSHGLVLAAELDGVVVGTGRLSEKPDPAALLHTRLELGYVVRADFAGRGIATEIALGMLAEARTRGHERVFARTRPENGASLRVLERAGFRSAGPSDAEGVLHLVAAL